MSRAILPLLRFLQTQSDDFLFIGSLCESIKKEGTVWEQKFVRVFLLEFLVVLFAFVDASVTKTPPIPVCYNGYFGFFGYQV